MTVTSVGFAPVKGTRHTSYDEVTLAPRRPGRRPRALLRRRRPAPRAADGAEPRLVALAARRDGEELAITLPDGSPSAASREPAARRSPASTGVARPSSTCSTARGPTPVSRTWAPPSGWRRPGRARSSTAPRSAWSRPPRCATWPSAPAAPALPDEAARFRPRWWWTPATRRTSRRPGSAARSGSARAVLRVNIAIPRCAVIDLDPRTGERGSGVLKALAGRGVDDHGDPLFGVDAHVVTRASSGPATRWGRRGGVVQLALRRRRTRPGPAPGTSSPRARRAPRPVRQAPHGRRRRARAADAEGLQAIGSSSDAAKRGHRSCSCGSWPSPPAGQSAAELHDVAGVRRLVAKVRGDTAASPAQGLPDERRRARR